MKADAARGRRAWPRLRVRVTRERVVVLLATATGILIFFWLLGIARPNLTDAQIEAAMVANIESWSDAPWYADIEGTPDTPAISFADGVLTVSSRLPRTTPAAVAYNFCLKVAAITHDSRSAVPFPIDKVVIVSGETLLARCFPPDS